LVAKKSGMALRSSVLFPQAGVQTSFDRPHVGLPRNLIGTKKTGSGKRGLVGKLETETKGSNADGGG